ncbi:MAG: sugar ABC transporter ATP-binding protein [Granulosicoccus sp.]
MSTTLKIRGVRKAFGTNQVLHDINFELESGEVTVLMGANGAGKSTLVKILSAVHTRDGGSISLFDQDFNPQTPAQAMAEGVVTVHQAINDGVVPDLDIASNLLLENLASGETGLWVRQATLLSKARRVADLVGLSVPLDTPVRRLSLADRQLVSIARAMAYEARVLILDEPTSSLSATEADRLFKLIDKLRRHGVAILYISHRMSDIRRLADRIVVMRDGNISADLSTKPLDLTLAVDAMLGRSMDDMRLTIVSGTPPCLTLDSAVLTTDSRPFNLCVHEGETVAVTGLVGSGKSALANVLFGLSPLQAGSMQLSDQRYQPLVPQDAIRQGVFLCPRDRGTNAIVPDFNLTRNITLPFVSRYSRLSWLDQRRERQRSTQLIDDMGVVCRSSDDNIGTLSGGNQQKISVARWLSEPCRLLILDEPFQGVDIQARRDISDRLRSSAGTRGTLVLVSEIDEAIEIADRIIVLAEHTVVGEHINRDPDMDLLLSQVASANKQGANAA